MKNVKLVSAAALFAVTVIGGQVAFAAPIPENVTKQNISRVELKASDEETEVTPPDVGPPTGPYEKVGILGITSTTNLLFPTIKLTGSIQTVNAQYVDTSKNTAPGKPKTGYITALEAPDATKPDGGFKEAHLDKAFVPGFSVTDKRGTGQGWKLQAKVGNFVTLKEDGTVANESDSEYHTLRGAYVNFPASQGITVKEATVDDPTKVQGLPVKLTAGGTADMIAKADAPEGRGVWEFRYDPFAINYKGTKRTKNPVTLTVPADNYAGQYQATMTWNLADAPDAEFPGA